MVSECRQGKRGDGGEEKRERERGGERERKYRKAWGRVRICWAPELVQGRLRARQLRHGEASSHLARWTRHHSQARVTCRRLRGGRGGGDDGGGGTCIVVDVDAEAEVEEEEKGGSGLSLLAAADCVLSGSAGGKEREKPRGVDMASASSQWSAIGARPGIRGSRPVEGQETRERDRERMEEEMDDN